MRNKVNVAAVQMKVLSKEKNLLKIVEYMKKAAGKAEIICFPECSFNWNKRKPSKETDLKLVKDAARQNRIFVVINGYFKDGKKVYNRTYLIDDRGKISGKYDKIYLWINELDVIRGKTPKVIKTKLGKIGLCTCWDLFFPELFNKLEKMGAEIIFCPSYWTDELKKESKFLESAPTVLAYQHMNFFVYCNALLKGKTSITQIAAPWGELSKIKFKEGMITATLYKKKMDNLRDKLKKAFWEK